MNHYQSAIESLQRLLDQLGKPKELSGSDLAGIYAAACIVIDRTNERASDEDIPVRLNIKKKLGEARAAIGALTGFEPDFGHDYSHHYTFAQGGISGARSGMMEAGVYDEA